MIPAPPLSCLLTASCPRGRTVGLRLRAHGKLRRPAIVLTKPLSLRLKSHGKPRRLKSLTAPPSETLQCPFVCHATSVAGYGTRVIGSSYTIVNDSVCVWLYAPSVAVTRTV